MDKSGIYLKHLREQKNLSQEYVAEQIGVSPSVISRMEISPEKFNIKKLGRYLAFFNKCFADYFHFKRPAENKSGPSMRQVIKFEIDFRDLNEDLREKLINHLHYNIQAYGSDNNG